MSILDSHITSIVIDAPHDKVVDFVASPQNLDQWTFGTWEIETLGDGVTKGKSLFDGGEIYVKVDYEPAFHMVHYLLSAMETGPFTARISARILPGPTLGLGANQSVFSLMVWRQVDMDDFRWHKLKTCHEAEVMLVKARLEHQ
ncbi:hypothetical protein [Maritalea mediterranea]|uniref:SRPBCC family protein n=1 Tax=Maritalea mediterranea TaxID=2909667 RepID=A0ABS9EBN5_9HYPH|nr:hypothetical protein [Maritalea mediterranea]MCF4099165.1 hypothetical protein [Maritalea mediterranea]